MFIPSEIVLFNQTIKIKYSRTLMYKHNMFASWEYAKNEIILQQSTRKCPLTPEQIEQSLIHELVHAALDLMGHDKLSSDEVFVCSMSNLIHQFIGQIENR